MVILNMKAILLMINIKEMENVYMKMVYIVQDNLKMVYFMEKEYYMIQMEKLRKNIIRLMVNLLVIKNKQYKIIIFNLYKK